jgi:hypothetical protein
MPIMPLAGRYLSLSSGMEEPSRTHGFSEEIPSFIIGKGERDYR